MFLAFSAVYVIWGSTYLAIKYAIETMPSFLMAGFRFLFAGGLLYVWARLSPGYERPTLRQWRTSLIVGTLLLAIGNGGVVVAEEYIPSSLAALLVATMPFWIVLLGWIFMNTGRPNLKVVLGLLLGFAGVAFLITGRGEASGSGDAGTGYYFGVAAIIVGTFGWAIGSLYGSRADTARSPILAAGMQMLTGGTVLILIGTVAGEWARFDLTVVSTASWLSFVYLVIFGAVIGYTAYSWLLKNVSPAAISTYAYVNPAIAVLLGWAVAGESMTGQMLIGAFVIVLSVALITSNNKRGIKTTEPKLEIIKGGHSEQPGYST